MCLRFLGCVVLVSIISCSGSRELPRDTPTIALDGPSTTPSTPVAPISSDSSTPTTASSAVAPSDSAVALPSPVNSAQAGPPTAYPDEWIQRARGENFGLSCLELVYKNGCRETRTGTVLFQVTIDENGTVMQFSEVDNQIRHEKAVVSKCLKKNLPRWKFHPPENHEKTFQISVALADRC